jgi:hypothetical protein
VRSRYVVDTNVLIAGSSVNSTSTGARDATPKEPEFRLKVWKWLSEFERSHSHLVLDTAGKIDEEYRNKLDGNDYGLQVLQYKYSRRKIDHVELSFDHDGYAILEAGLMKIVADHSDRKMVGAAIEAKNTSSECAIANASDTDWYDWEEALRARGIEIEQIIPEWSRPKWEEKKKR